jgi:hypothetical protein
VTDISSEPKTSFIYRDSRKSRGSSKFNAYPLKSTRSIQEERRMSRRNSPRPGSNSSNSSNEKGDMTGRYNRVSSTLEVLNSIEKKLDQLKQNIKRHSPKHVDHR